MDFAREIGALIVCLSTSIAAASAQTCSTAGQCPHKNMRAAIDTALARESEHDWHKIHWRTSASLALREAQAESKPIFVFFVVKQQAPSPTKWTGQADDTGKT